MTNNRDKKSSNQKLEISVIICTYNRKKLLAEAVESIIKQKLDKKRFEIIIVDNNSTDGTFDLIKSLKAKYTECNIVCLHEKKQGLSRARNTGYKNAHGAYIAFLDDDAKANNQWLNRALLLFKSVIPEPFAIGGPIYPIYESSKPKWFKNIYETRIWGEKARYLRRGEAFSGSNVFFQKRIIESLGGFDERIGMKGKTVSVGEETDLFERIWKTTFSEEGIYYSPKLKVYHVVPSYKMTVCYQIKRSFMAGSARSIRNDKLSYPARLIKTIVNILGLFIFILFAIIQLPRYRNHQNWLIEQVGRLAYFLGYILRQIGYVINFHQNR